MIATPPPAMTMPANSMTILARLSMTSARSRIFHGAPDLMPVPVIVRHSLISASSGWPSPSSAMITRAART